MISKLVGTNWRGNTKLRLGVAIVLSNAFVYLLFSGSSVEALPVKPSGLVEVKLEAELRTPFEAQKKVILLHRSSGTQIEALLESALETQYVVSVRDEVAQTLFKKSPWEILPYMKNLTMPVARKGESLEIQY
jgi:hypothetical protein